MISDDQNINSVKIEKIIAGQTESQKRLAERVNILIGSQTTWNEAHDKRSSEVLEDLKNAFDRAFGAISEVQAQLAKIPCDRRNEQIKALAKLTEEKVNNVGKSIKWLWIGFSGSLSVVCIAFAVVIKIVS